MRHQRDADNIILVVARVKHSHYRIPLQASPGHHVSAALDERRGGAVNARSRAPCAVGAERRGIEGAEHRCTLVWVMAGLRIDRALGTVATTHPRVRDEVNTLADSTPPLPARATHRNKQHASRGVNDPRIRT